MHDTAQELGALFFERYFSSGNARVFELGSQDVNGTLRTSAPESWWYIGADLEPGRGVDVCVSPERALPFGDGSFDIVVASSVFEHDPFFWRTFVDLCRIVRPDGLIYLNAPSNGTFHRYPADYWRFYPDCGKALAAWARDQGHSVSLVESFVAERKSDIWNDFCAVFQKSLKPTPPSRGYICDAYACTNIVRFGSEIIDRHREATEDMHLLRWRDHETMTRLEAAERALARERMRSRVLVRQISGSVDPSFEGHVDEVSDMAITGWCCAGAFPDERLCVTVVQGELEIASAVADLWRADLLGNGKGDGAYGFNIGLPPNYVRRARLKIVARARNGAIWELPSEIET